METIRDTDPKLAIPAPAPIGRLYRLPGSASLTLRANGSPAIPRNSEIMSLVQSGTWAPSITNVIDMLNKPHLVTWGAKVAIQELIKVESRYPGVTLQKPSKALAYYKVEHERQRDAAADKGTTVHNACEMLANGQSLDDLVMPLTEEEALHVESWKNWRERWNPEFLATEVTVFGTTLDGLHYAGTADFVARINGKIVAGDLKTTRSGLHDEVSLQLTAVARAQSMSRDGEKMEPNFVVDAAIAVHLSAEGYAVKQADISDEKWEVFSGLRRAWMFNAFRGQTSPNHPALSRSLAGPEMLVFDAS